ncbi:lipoprotein signal peptidase [Runella sp.]|jgi:signal peptidase II|uniref:lipoprotein signal peptidase n=1 Tax=Runella sp. TaxID=1960881 RepID=UPI00260EA050|nr:lipoprotein signal peptidase [Runella sp.]
MTSHTAKNPFKFFLFALLLIAVDQASKLLVNHYMSPGFAGQIRIIGDWLKLYYVTNPGMAFGMQIDHEYGKLFLTTFRLGAMVFIAWYMVRLAVRGASSGLLWAMSMILAGAIGNLIDSIFYGVLIGNAPYGSPTPWFHGQVIDMVFIDFWEGFVPEWVPVWGGQYYTTPIFNFADACIFVGVCIILMFQGTFFPRLDEPHTETQPESDAEIDSESDSTSEPIVENSTEEGEKTEAETAADEEEAKPDEVIIEPEPTLEVPPKEDENNKNT